ncbi:hypothetical protein [Haloarcula onubensis]|uniref:Uncharacterized protein n=1 Tax=Haloarcula onubensis TaxID=2950539 RepID=A0ABU2FND5_9EURY|nr:hypothetical protein [Halomicroarcula sp. S3CR25-11]MDS0282264.1 hypothetical protein [Halomicroarcula sp. S3CR25-11]
MSMKISAGLQDSGTTDESVPENAEADINLAELIERSENTDWNNVPGTIGAEADTRMAHLIEMRGTVRGRSVIVCRTVPDAAIALSGVSVSTSNVGTDGGSDDINEDDSNAELDYGRNTIVNTSAGWRSGRTATTAPQNRD